MSVKISYDVEGKRLLERALMWPLGNEDKDQKKRTKKRRKKRGVEKTSDRPA